MSKAPEICRYCDGKGNGSAGSPCGFCKNGKPLDSQEDWDRSWGCLNERVKLFVEELKRKRRDG